MKIHRKSNRRVRLMAGVGMISLLSPLSSQALCLKNCQSGDTAQRGTIQTSAPSTNYQQNQADRRIGSHNFGDTSTNVMGDMNIQVGHEKIEIKGMENSTNSIIDTSISSTIILGNVKQ